MSKNLISTVYMILSNAQKSFSLFLIFTLLKNKFPSIIPLSSDHDLHRGLTKSTVAFTYWIFEKRESFFFFQSFSSLPFSLLLLSLSHKSGKSQTWMRTNSDNLNSVFLCCVISHHLIVVSFVKLRRRH